MALSTPPIRVTRDGAREQAKEILKTRMILNEIYAHHTKQPLDAIERAVERDMYMSAEEAKAFGLVDLVLQRRESAEPAPGPGESSSSAPEPARTDPRSGSV